MLKQNRSVGAIYAIILSVFISSAYSTFSKKKAADSDDVVEDLSMEKFEKMKFKINSHIVRRNDRLSLIMDVSNSLLYLSDQRQINLKPLGCSDD